MAREQPTGQQANRGLAGGSKRALRVRAGVRVSQACCKQNLPLWEQQRHGIGGVGQPGVL